MIRATALLLTLMTGFSGLVYEVAWQRYLGTLLGSQSEATAAVLAIFLGGLSVGYWLFGRVTRRVVERAADAGVPPRLLLVYGAVEVGIGLYVIAFPWLFKALQALSYAIPHGPAGVGFGIDVALAALLIGPASVLMGGTIPILTQGLARSLEDATRFHAFVYAFNTVGAFGGALAAGFYLVPRLGLVNVMLSMGLINLTAGAVFAVMGFRGQAVVSLEEDSSLGDSDGSSSNFAPFMAVALLTGFAMMAVQTTLIRLAGLSFGSSQFTFSMVVAVFVLCIALGSFLVSALSRISPLFVVLNQWGLALSLLLLYSQLENSPYWAHFLRSLFRDETAAFGFYYFLVFLALLAVIGLPVILSGASLPLLFHQMRREVGHLGDLAGTLYSWNTIGSLLGALLGGYLLLFWFDLHHVYRLAVMALLLAALVLTMRVYRWRGGVALVALPLLALVFFMPPWNPEDLTVGLFRERSPLEGTFDGPETFRAVNSGRFDGPILFHDDDPIASITLKEFVRPGGGKSVSILTNGKSDSNTYLDLTTVGMLAALPALMARKAEKAFVIGWGTGITAGELASLDSMTQVDVAEIAPSVVRAAPFFDFASQKASQNPKVRIIQSDAYRALMRSKTDYDLIISEPSNPWVTGVEMLFSREFLAAARDRLTEGGVYVQWIHQYETDDATLALVLRTYTEVFDHVAVWGAGYKDLLLLGLKEPGPATDHFRLEERALRSDFSASLDRMGIASFPALLAHEIVPVGVLHAANLEGPIHSLYHPILNDQAGRAFFRGDTGSLPFLGYGEPARLARENSMLQGYMLRFREGLPDQARAELIRESYRSIGAKTDALVAEWIEENPDSQELKGLRKWIEQSKFQGGKKGAGEEAQVDRAQDLVRFFEKRSELGEFVTPHYARRATEDFMRFFHHGAPFDPDQLIKLWGSCREGRREPQWCQEWAHVESRKLGSSEETKLLEGCLANRFVGDQCREGLEGARRLVETGKASFSGN
ncbi:MAG: fused MFS/spermidine synthase [Myxococcota bacterium]|nr:fused MFS/spermidine synthase [Myxococcota bacterium]